MSILKCFWTVASRHFLSADDRSSWLQSPENAPAHSYGHISGPFQAQPSPINAEPDLARISELPGTLMAESVHVSTEPGIK